MKFPHKLNVHRKFKQQTKLQHLQSYWSEIQSSPLHPQNINLLPFFAAQEPWYFFSILDCKASVFNVTLMAVNSLGQSTLQKTDAIEIKLSKFSRCHTTYSWVARICSYRLSRKTGMLYTVNRGSVVITMYLMPWLDFMCVVYYHAHATVTYQSIDINRWFDENSEIFILWDLVSFYWRPDPLRSQWFRSTLEL